MARALTAAVTALVLAGCGSGGGPADAPLSVQANADGDEIALFEAVADTFAERTGVAVRFTPTADRKEYAQKLATSFAARRGPDVFVVNHRNVGPYVSQIDPAGPRLRDPDAFFDVALDAFRVGGELQCVPSNASSLVVYLNLDRLRAAGVRPPRGPWSYGSFLRTARTLKRAAGRDAHAVGIDPALIRVAPFVWGAGGEIVDDPNAPTRLTLGEGAGRAGLEALLSLRVEDLAPDAEAVQALALEERFLAGRLGMFFSSRREVPNFRAISDFDWDVAPFPTLARPATVLHSDGFCVKRGPRADAAARFVAFATGPEGQAILARGGRIVPSRRAVAASDAFLAPGNSPASARVFVDAIDGGMRRLPSTRSFTRVDDAAGLALEQAFYGSSTLDRALERIARETDGELGAP